MDAGGTRCGAPPWALEILVVDASSPPNSTGDIFWSRDWRCWAALDAVGNTSGVHTYSF